MNTLSGAFKATFLAMLLLTVIAPLLTKPNPSPFSAKQDRGGETVIHRSTP